MWITTCPSCNTTFGERPVHSRDAKDFTMVFFYVGKDTLHMMVTPNPTPDAGTCVIIFERIAEPIMPWPEIGEEEEP